MPHARHLLLAALPAIAVLALPGTGHAADRATFMAVCEKDKAAEAKASCACIADAIEKALTDKARAFAFRTLSQSAGELVLTESGLTEKEEDAVTDQTFQIMKGCGQGK